MGLIDATVCLQKYRDIAGGFNDLLAMGTEIVNETECVGIVESLHSKRNEFYSIVTKPYQNI